MSGREIQLGACARTTEVLNWPGKMDTPSGLTLDPAGHIVVADTWNNRVQVFEPTGALVMTFGKQGTMPGELEYPNDVLIIPANSLSGVEV